MDHDLRRLLNCVECDGPLQESFSCASCGFVADFDGDTPVLRPATGDVSYTVRHVSLDEAQETLRRVFGLGERSGADASVYHLDGQHRHALEALPKGAVVLEIGCGGGQMRAYVRSLGHAYVGTDVSKTRVGADLQAHGGPDFISDAHFLPMTDASVDVVYSAAVTEHLSSPLRALQQIFRVLKPGGLFMGNCSFLEPWHDESFFHVTPNGAASLLLATGFEVEAMWPSRNYSGYDALLGMGSKTARLLRFMGPVMRRYADMTYAIKRKVRGAAGYGDQGLAFDLARTAGAVDWIARKGT